MVPTEISSWQERKIESLFVLLDNDGNGRLEEPEMLSMLERLWLDAGWSETSRVVGHLSGRWKALLDRLFARRTSVTLADWRELIQRALLEDRSRRLAQASYRGPLEEVAQLLFLVLDRDRDHGIDEVEFSLFFHALGHGHEDSLNCFQRLDKNQDGRLERQELEDLILDFFHGTEPGGHGDWLFGPPPRPLPT